MTESRIRMACAARFGARCIYAGKLVRSGLLYWACEGDVAAAAAGSDAAPAGAGDASTRARCRRRDGWWSGSETDPADHRPR